jgi:hypothetical protein
MFVLFLFAALLLRASLSERPLHHTRCPRYLLLPIHSCLCRLAARSICIQASSCSSCNLCFIAGGPLGALSVPASSKENGFYYIWFVGTAMRRAWGRSRRTVLGTQLTASRPACGPEFEHSRCESPCRGAATRHTPHCVVPSEKRRSACFDMREKREHLGGFS